MSDTERSAQPARSATVVQSEPVFQSAGSLPAVPGYALSREIARGGMGVVYAAHDPIFGREVAVKVMHPGHDVNRFVVEARVTAQLPHPGVPPVHALGTLPDGRPFLAMKLIKGRTLAQELKSTTRADLPRLLSAFEQICLTVGFAHSRGIIHRDLKPANVMVGPFGEVLVLDWGLAREARGTDGRPIAEPLSVPGSAARAAHAASTQTGEVKGTPAYMAPEQARGEAVDARTDVFGLGGLLAAILTGNPPFVGDTVLDTVQRAARADLGECFEELDDCGADAELIAVAKRALAAHPADRFADGEEVAAAVAAHRASVEERLRAAERDRAAAEARAAEQRKRRRVQLALAGAVLLLVCGGGAVAWWQNDQANARKLADERAAGEQRRIAGERDAEARLKADQARQGIRAARRLADELRREYKFAPATASLSQAAELARTGAPELLPEVKTAQRDLAFVVRLDDIRFRKWTFIPEPRATGRFNTRIAAPEYRKALAEYGLDLPTLNPADAAKRIAASDMKADLVAAVDDWALYEPNEALVRRLLEVARRADPGPWADRLRDPAVRADSGALAKLAAETDPAATPPAALSVLVELMDRADLDPFLLLSAARARYPANFELAFALGRWNHLRRKGDMGLGAYEAARALRPDNLTCRNDLANLLSRGGEQDAAVAAFRESIRLDPKFPPSHYNLGVALLEKNDHAGALAAFRETVNLDPLHAEAHHGIGIVYSDQGELDRALAAFREAVRHDPLHARAHFNIGVMLEDKREIAGALAAYREAVRLDPDYARAHLNLGNLLQDAGDLVGAVAAFRAALKLDPRYVNAHYNLGNALVAIGKDIDGAVAAYTAAIEIDPKFALAHVNLGIAYFIKGDHDRATAALKGALKLDPTLAKAHYNLAVVYAARDDVPEALASSRAAIRFNPKYAAAHAMLGKLLQQTGDVSGARAALVEAARLDKRYAEQLAALPAAAPAARPAAEIAPPPREVKRP